MANAANAVTRMRVANFMIDLLTRFGFDTLKQVSVRHRRTFHYVLVGWSMPAQRQGGASL
jgi:hypothetical protein